MPKITFKRVRQGQTVRAADLNDNFEIAEAALNNLDQSNWASGKIFPLDKLKQASANTNDLLVRGASAWEPRSASDIGSTFFPALSSYSPTVYDQNGAVSNGWSDLGSRYLRVGGLVIATIRVSRIPNSASLLRTVSLPVAAAGPTNVVIGHGFIEFVGVGIRPVVAILLASDRVGITGTAQAFPTTFNPGALTAGVMSLQLMYQAA